MSPRLVPYAGTPVRAVRQVAADLTVLFWVIVWVLVGRTVHAAVSGIAAVGRRVESGANGIAGNLDSAGRGAGRVPLIGDPVSSPLRSAGDAARSIAEAGHGLDERATWLALVLSLAVALPPILGVVLPWLFVRVRFVRRASAAAQLAGNPSGEQLLAMRALANQPLTTLAAIGSDPMQAWREGDPSTVRALATLELRSVGLRSPRGWRS